MGFFNKYRNLDNVDVNKNVQTKEGKKVVTLTTVGDTPNEDLVEKEETITSKGDDYDVFEGDEIISKNKGSANTVDEDSEDILDDEISREDANKLNEIENEIATSPAPNIVNHANKGKEYRNRAPSIQYSKGSDGRTTNTIPQSNQQSSNVDSDTEDPEMLDLERKKEELLLAIKDKQLRDAMKAKKTVEDNLRAQQIINQQSQQATQTQSPQEETTQQETTQKVRAVYLTEAEMLREMMYKIERMEAWAVDLTNYLKSKNI